MTTTANIMSYKYGHLAAHAIESVLGQTKKFDVVRFYDDGAGDCEHLPNIYPEVEFILRPENLGVVDNFNDALDRTETEQVMFLGADNWLSSNALEMLVFNQSDIITYDALKYLDTGTEPWIVNGHPHGSSLYNVELAKSVGMYEASGNNHTEEDSVLFSKMIANGARVGYVQAPLLNYRWRHRRNYNQ